MTSRITNKSKGSSKDRGATRPLLLESIASGATPMKQYELRRRVL